jgi:hypothetical protein
MAVSRRAVEQPVTKSNGPQPRATGSTPSEGRGVREDGSGSNTLPSASRKDSAVPDRRLKIRSR